MQATCSMMTNLPDRQICRLLLSPTHNACTPQAHIHHLSVGYHSKMSNPWQKESLAKAIPWTSPRDSWILTVSLQCHLAIVDKATAKWQAIPLSCRLFGQVACKGGMHMTICCQCHSSWLAACYRAEAQRVVLCNCICFHLSKQMLSS